MDGECFYYYGTGIGHGWIFPATDRQRPPAPLYFWAHCPFCGGELPDLAAGYSQFLRDLTSDEGAE